MVFCFENCSDLLREKDFLGIEKKLPDFCDRTVYSKTVKGQNKFWKRKVFNLFIECSNQIYYIGTIKMPIGTNIWDVET